MKKIILCSLIALLFAVPMISVQAQVVASTPTPSEYEPFPTATAYVQPETSTENVYTNDEYGFSITIPDAVEATTEDPSTGVFQSYVMGDSEVFGYLYPEAMSSEQTLREVAKGAYDYQAEGLADIEILKDEERALPNGGNAWYSQFRGYVTESDYTVEIRLTTVINGKQAFSLMLYSLPENFVYWNNAANEMRDSITLLTPTVLGHPRSQVLILEGGESSNPLEYDPATMHGSGDYLVFEGLVTYNEKLEVVPALAAGWEVSEDGTVYTFHLQPDAVFHNGKPVTAEDVVYSWERAAHPDTNSDTVMTYLNDIVGVKEMHEGLADTISGLKVIDEHTLQVTLDAPKAYFLYKLTYATAMVLDRDNVESGTNWYITPNGTGPYRLVRWDSMERIIYERFEDYYGTPPAIPTILYTLYTGDDFRLYEEGAVDIAGVPVYNVERVSQPSDPLNKELLTGVSMCTEYVAFDVTKPPFDDVKVRQAFSMAFDKEKYLEIVLKNTDYPAKGIYPPALPGYNLDLKGIEFDPEKARQLIAESSYGSVDAFPEIVFTSTGWGSYTYPLESALSHMWQQNLGVTISIQNLDPEKFYDPETSNYFGQLSSSGWCADYPDPENFADVLFHSGAEMNKGNYSNPELDRILEEARVEPDVDRRIELYQQAEQMLVDDAAALFLFHSGTFTLVKPYITGYIDAPVSAYPTIRYLSIDPSFWE